MVDLKEIKEALLSDKEFVSSLAKDVEFAKEVSKTLTNDINSQAEIAQLEKLEKEREAVEKDESLSDIVKEVIIADIDVKKKEFVLYFQNKEGLQKYQELKKGIKRFASATINVGGRQEQVLISENAVNVLLKEQVEYLKETESILNDIIKQGLSETKTD